MLGRVGRGSECASYWGEAFWHFRQCPGAVWSPGAVFVVLVVVALSGLLLVFWLSLSVSGLPVVC